LNGTPFVVGVIGVVVFQIAFNSSVKHKEDKMASQQSAGGGTASAPAMDDEVTIVSAGTSQGRSTRRTQFDNPREGNRVYLAISSSSRPHQVRNFDALTSIANSLSRKGPEALSSCP
jgi:hypothetical protein